MNVFSLCRNRAGLATMLLVCFVMDSAAQQQPLFDLQGANQDRGQQAPLPAPGRGRNDNPGQVFGNRPNANVPPAGQAVDIADANIDQQLQALIAQHGLDGDPIGQQRIPSIESPLAQLGRQLFFSKSLGGGFDAACVTCHHPLLGGGDGLSLPVGVAAVVADLLGPGRVHQSGLPPVPRNSPTVFNSVLWGRGLFWDSRVERLRPNDAGQRGIRTPDSGFGEADPLAGNNLLEAQARFPVVSEGEMKTAAFEPGSDNNRVRDHLAGRLGNYGPGEGELEVNLWPQTFQLAFDSVLPPQGLLTFASIATAVAAYEASMVFVDNPWSRYVQGDLGALTAQQKQGARLFYAQAGQGGAGCVNCHGGDFFSDQRHHNVAFPQFGPGKGDGLDGAADFGRARETGQDQDQFDFRTPSLLNVAVTAPYGHAGAYSTLEQVVRHYRNPRAAVNRFFNGGGACNLAQFAAIDNCDVLYPTAVQHSDAALDDLAQEQRQGQSLLRPSRLNNTEVDQLVSFLHALTDPCVQDRNCLAPWIAPVTDTGPDGQQLNAISEAGDLL